MNIQDVTLVNLQPPQYVHAFTNGSVDALVAGNMFIDPIQRQLGVILRYGMFKTARKVIGS